MGIADSYTMDTVNIICNNTAPFFVGSTKTSRSKCSFTSSQSSFPFFLEETTWVNDGRMFVPVGGRTNPFEQKYKHARQIGSNWIISPGIGGENNYLKPPPRKRFVNTSIAPVPFEKQSKLERLRCPLRTPQKAGYHKGPHLVCINKCY